MILQPSKSLQINYYYFHWLLMELSKEKSLGGLMFVVEVMNNSSGIWYSEVLRS